MKQLLDQLTAKHIIFDLDGTLIDSAPGILESFRVACEECLVKPAVPLKASLIGPPLMKTLEKIAGSSKSEVLIRLAAAFKAHYDNHGYKNTTPFEGVPELLAALKIRDQCLYIATNKRNVATSRIVKHFGWESYFSGLYSLDSLSPALSTKHELLTHIVNKYQLCRRETCYVGDRSEDADAARVSHLPFIGVGWGYGVADDSMAINWQTT